MSNIFEKKLKETKSKGLPTNPIELYQTCNYQEGYEYLRGIQEEVLKSWEEIRVQRDVICKMNTGSGKTLTGLLMLYSKLIEKNEPALYLCPDSQLVEQTVKQAALYGIPVCTFDEASSSEIPLDFVNSKKILVCNFYKLFNGKSIFVRKNIKIGSIVIDDAHKCVDIAREQSSMSLKRNHSISKRLFEIFTPELKNQLQGTFVRLKDGDPYLSMKVPYWSWMDNQDTIINIVSEEVATIEAASLKAWKEKKTTNNDDTPLRWNVIADNLLSYDCYVSGTQLEIVPIHVPYHFFKPFHEASHRYILSATFEDDYDLIKDLGISYDSIINPIVPSDRKDIGKRLILTPSRFDAKIIDDELRNFIAGYVTQDYNVVVLVPSANHAKNWTNKGATLVTAGTIKQSIKTLESSKGNFMVFANRYDGMDLHGDSCRVLVLDGLPVHNSIQEYYTETRLENLRAGRKAQIIEQGLGRAVRSGGDYCVVYLMGIDLLGFLGVQKNLEHFTPVTRAQVRLGLELLDGEENTNSLKIIKDTAMLALTQNKQWTEYHSQHMQEVSADVADKKKSARLDYAECERAALVEFRLRKYVPSGEVILSEIVNKRELTNKEKGWYYQFAAQLSYPGNIPFSNDLQSKACLHSDNMLHPPMGHVYNKAINKGAQSSLIKKRISEFERPQDILNYIQGLLNQLIYTPERTAKSFEDALAELGEFLGFQTQMPDASYGDGPDVLWMLPDGHALILEAKSRRISDEISKDNIEQLMQSELWFKEHYGADAKYDAVTLQPNSKKGKSVHVDGHKIIDGEHLEMLHTALIKFATALQTTSPKAHTEESISKLLVSYKLTPQLIRTTYIKTIK